MKKLILSMIGISFLFLSCDKELIEFQEDDSLSFSISSSLESVRCEADIEALESSLPDVVSLTTTTKLGPDAYFTINILDTNLAGTDILAWCADLVLSLDIEGPLDFAVYSSYGDNIPNTVFAQPENLGKVNWILNQDYVGSTSPSGGTYTYGHVQYALWDLLNSYNCNICDNLTNPTGTWGPDDKIKGEEIITAASSKDGFIPGCGQKIGVVLVPDGKQPLIILLDVPEKEIEVECDTAFAIGNDDNGGDDDDTTCFLEDGFNRWGWTIGPLAEGEYTYDVYAGAGQCDISKGDLAGTVTVTYSGGNVDVTYHIDNGYELNETHVYAGNEKYPKGKGKKGKETVAPGQYTIQDNLTGDIYVIAHAVVCN